MSKLLRANFIRMLRSLEFMVCALFSLTLGLFNVAFTCGLNSANYITTFENDFFNMSMAVIFISAVFVGLFFGTENSVLRNKLTVGHTRGAVYGSNCLTAVCAAFVINALSMLPYALIAPFCGAKIGDLSNEKLALNILIEVLAVMAAGCVCFLVTVIFTRKSYCAAGSLLAAVIMMFLPKTDGAMRYSPFGQLETLLNKEYTSSFMAVCSTAVIIMAAVIGAAVFAKKNLK